MIGTGGLKVVSAAVLFLLSVGPAWAFDVGPGATALAPNLIQLTGFVSSAPPGTETIGSLTLGLPDGEATLVLLKVQLRNNSLTEGRAALRSVELFNPNLRVVGDPLLLQAIRQAAPQSPITVFGYLNTGSRRLHVVTVQPG